MFRVVFGFSDRVSGVTHFETDNEADAFKAGFSYGTEMFSGDEAWCYTTKEFDYGIVEEEKSGKLLEDIKNAFL